MFDKYCVDKIKNGEKCVTRRLIKSNRRPAVPGTIHKLKINRTADNYGYILINSCSKSKLGEVTDKEAKKEGFGNAQEYFEYFRWVNNIKGQLSKDYEVWRVRFTYLGENIYEK